MTSKLTLKSTLRLNSGASIPILGFGTYLITGSNCTKAVRTALKLGYRHIDTATFYNNEVEVGKAIREAIAQDGIPRSEIFVTTKMWYTEHGYDSALKAFDKSFKKLGLDYIDLYLVHWPEVEGAKDPAKVRAETWRAFEKLVESGKVKSIGVSNFEIKHLEELLKTAKIVPATNQCECHPLLSQEKLRKYCKEKGIVFEAYSPLAKGKILNNETIKKIAKKYNKSVAQICLRWNIQHGMVTLPKSANEQRIKENMEIFDFELSEEDMNTLDGLNKNWHCTWDPTDVE